MFHTKLHITRMIHVDIPAWPCQSSKTVLTTDEI